MLRFIIGPLGVGKSNLLFEKVDFLIDAKFFANMPSFYIHQLHIKEENKHEVIKKLTSLTEGKNVLIKEFHEFFKVDNFNGFENFTKELLESLANSANVIATSSHVNEAKEWLKNNNFTWIEYDKIPDELFIKHTIKYLGNFNPILAFKIYQLTYPKFFYFNLLTKFIEPKYLTVDLDKRFEKILLKEADLFLTNFLENSLNRCRGVLTLKTIISFLAIAQPLRVSELAKMLNRNAGQVSGYLQHLKNSDLLIYDDNQKVYKLNDPVLTFWLRYKLGYKTPNLINITYPNQSLINQFTENLQRKKGFFAGDEFIKLRRLQITNPAIFITPNNKLFIADITIKISSNTYLAFSFSSEFNQTFKFQNQKIIPIKLSYKKWEEIKIKAENTENLSSIK